MRRILLENITSGMKLAKPLYSAEGIVLLTAGIEITERFVTRLKELDVTYIYVEDELTQDIDIPDVISEKTRVEAVSTAKQIIEQIKVGRGVDASQAKKVSNMLVDELCQNHGVMLNFVDMRTSKDYLFSHCVNVSVLAIMTGINFGFDELRLRDLGVGALLHDVGKTQISQEVLNKKDRLTVTELAEIKKHPVLGFEILRKNPDISLVSAHCAFQHHERFDGTGYPRGLKDDEIHQFAQIVAIADVYDALTSDSSYRQAVSVYEALAIILKAGGTYFNEELVNRFVENIAVYPIGSVIRLNNNQIGVVVDISREYKTKPVVRIILDENKQAINQLMEIDLSKNPRLYIADVVER
jgi:HD-GYP domain-containing protein (c-di-GMP phosphodiesterase class II)